MRNEEPVIPLFIPKQAGEHSKKSAHDKGARVTRPLWTPLGALSGFGLARFEFRGIVGTDQRAEARSLLGGRTGLRPTHWERAMKDTALTCADIIRQTGERNQHQTAMIGGGGGL